MKEEEFASVWDALADTEQEATNLKARAALMHLIHDEVGSWGVKQEDAAKRLGVTRPRLNDLLMGRLAKFSLDALLNLAVAAGLQVEITAHRAA